MKRTVSRYGGLFGMCEATGKELKVEGSLSSSSLLISGSNWERIESLAQCAPIIVVISWRSNWERIESG
jgi:hypothetical protein